MARLEKASWNIEAVELMARTGMSLVQEVAEMGLDITSEECDKLLRSKGFNRLLWEHRHRYFNDLSANPNFKKDTVIGKLISLAQRLEDQGDHDKSAEVLFKIAKMQQWVGIENQVNVFGDLSQSDIDDIRKKLSQPVVGKVN